MFYLILLFAILIPFILKNKLSLIFSFFLIFILWGLEYQMVQDWNGNVARWYGCIRSIGYNVADQGAGNKTLEPLYVAISRWHEPVGYYGQLITTAIFGLIMFYNLITRYVPPKYYWLSIFVFFIRPSNALLLFNSNRQSIALLFTMIAVFILIKNYNCKKIQDLIKLILALICIKAATLVHSAAAFAYILPILYFATKYIDLTKHNIMLIVCNVLFLGRFFFNAEILTDYILASEVAGMFNEHYYAYADNLGTENKAYSLLESVLYVIPMNYALISFNKMKPEFKFFTLAFTAAMILNGYFTSNLGRVLQFYHIYMIVLIPYLIELLVKEKNNIKARLRKPALAFMLCYSIFAFFQAMQGYLYCRWNDFQTTIFDAPMWM